MVWYLVTLRSIHLHGAYGLAASIYLLVAYVAAALTGGRALSVLTAIAHRLAASVRRLAVALQAGAFVGGHTVSEGTARLALRLTVLTGHLFQDISLATLALVPFVAHPVATTQGAGGDALSLGGPDMAGNADAGVRRRADPVGAVVGADWLAAAVDVGIPFVAVAAHLDATHVGSGAVADELVSGVAKKGGSAA